MGRLTIFWLINEKTSENTGFNVIIVLNQLHLILKSRHFVKILLGILCINSEILNENTMGMTAGE